MKVAAIPWRTLSTNSSVYDWMTRTLHQAKEENVQLIVFPALLGSLFKPEAHFLNKMISLSEQFPDILICPGSYFEKVKEHTYHSSFVVQNGHVLWKQRQLYLAKWERELKLSCGEELMIFKCNGVKMAIILSTDVFYPQVARFAAMQGVELVLSPIAMIKPTSFLRQLSGLWQNVQQNIFFAIESAYHGEFVANSFFAKSIIHAPLELTENEDGLLKVSDDEMVTATLPLEMLTWAKQFYHPIRQLNTLAYRKIFK